MKSIEKEDREGSDEVCGELSPEEASAIGREIRLEADKFKKTRSEILRELIKSKNLSEEDAFVVASYSSALANESASSGMLLLINALQMPKSDPKELSRALAPYIKSYIRGGRLEGLELIKLAMLLDLPEGSLYLEFFEEEEYRAKRKDWWQ